MRLSVRRALYYDYPAFLGWMFGLGFWVLWLLVPSARKMLLHSEVVLILGLVWTTCWLALTIWRVARLARLFRVGRLAPARITNESVGFNGPVTCDFTFDEDGSPVNARMYVTTWVAKQFPRYYDGFQALYDPDWIFRAVILQLFEVPPSPAADDTNDAA